jgi:mRNA interferase MazF
VLSARAYNQRVGLCVACPITNAKKGYPFEVEVPAGVGVSGVILSDQVRSLSWVERRASLIGDAPDEVVEDARARIAALIGID